MVFVVVFGCLVCIENDVNFVVFVEFIFGVGGDFFSFVFLFLDDGFGVGIVIDGILYWGFLGVVGEVMYLL